MTGWRQHGRPDGGWPDLFASPLGDGTAPQHNTDPSALDAQVATQQPSPAFNILSQPGPAARNPYRDSPSPPGPADLSPALLSPALLSPALLSPVPAPAAAGEAPAQPLYRPIPISTQYPARLLAECLTLAEFAIAAEAADHWQVPLYRAAIALGLITETAYAQALAAVCGVAYAEAGLLLTQAPDIIADQISRRAHEPPVHALWIGHHVVAVSATSADPTLLAGELARLKASGHNPVLTTETEIVAAHERIASQTLLDRATRTLARRRPDVSASRRVPVRQLAVFTAILGLPAGAFAIYPHAMMSAAAIAAALYFALVVAVRVVALVESLRPARRRYYGVIADDAELPRYSVLVPLVDETEVLPDLIAALENIDYPRAKLDIILILEARDPATQAALAEIALPPHIRTLVVPDGAPRTKPKALNYALYFARGDYLVVYDAEDRPDPAQLRQALYAFEHGGPDLACVQAPLNIYNARQSWFSRQFALEYSTLFDATLPALDRLGIPVPLGGTSNHFPRGVIDAMLGWDPYNVTEDADLGMRIARRRWRTVTISATTWEEAPVQYRQWLGQRTRWIKGWMQTILVHTRRHRSLRRDLGLARTLGFHVYMGGLVISALLHPIFYLGLIASYSAQWSGLAIWSPEPILAGALWTFAITTLLCGYVVSIAANTISGARRGHWFVLQPFLTPLYWLLISAAAYRALFQLMTDPHRWEKTRHGLTRAKPARPDTNRKHTPS